MEPKEKTAVLADRSAEDRARLREILEQGGYTVAGEACDGVDLVRLCEELRPGMVFLEIPLPYLDGLTAASHLRRQGLAELIFFVTGQSDGKLVAAARDLGAGGYLLKPATKKQLLPSLSAALARNRARARIRQDFAEIEQQISLHRTLERAKCAVMEREGLGAEEALAFLREVAAEKQMPVVKLAELFAARSAPPSGGLRGRRPAPACPPVSPAPCLRGGVRD